MDKPKRTKSRTKVRKLEGKVNAADKQVKMIEKKLEGKLIKEDIADLYTGPEYYLKRIQLVSLELMKGMNPIDIARKYTEEWNVSVTTIRTRYVKEARYYISQELVLDDKNLKVDLLSKYHYLYQLNIERNELKEARAVLDSMTRVTTTLETNIQIIGNINTIELVEHIKTNENLLDE